MNGLPEDFATVTDPALTAPALNGGVLAAVVLILVMLAVATLGLPSWGSDPDPEPLTVAPSTEPDPEPATGWRRDYAAQTLRWHEDGRPTPHLARWHD